MSRESKLESLAIDGAGRIAAAGREDSDDAAEFAIARYTTGGELDAGFGTGGVTRTAVSGWSEAHDVVALADGTMVVAGSANDSSDIGLARLNADGTLAEGFGTQGKVVTEAPETDSIAYAITAPADGRSAVVGGRVGQDMGAARYTVIPVGGGPVDPIDDGDDTGDEEPKKDEPKKDEPRKEEPRQQTAPPAAVVAPPAVVRAQPVPRRCVSRRLFTVNPRTLGLSGATVTAVGRRAKVVRLGGSRHRIDLRRLPVGTYSIRITGRTKSGRSRTVTKTYRTCA